MLEAQWINIPNVKTSSTVRNYPTQKQIAIIGTEITGTAVFPVGTVFICVVDYVDEFQPSQLRKFYFKKPGEIEFTYLTSFAVAGELPKGSSTSFVIRGKWLHAISVSFREADSYHRVFYGSYDLSTFQSGTWTTTQLNAHTNSYYQYQYPDLDVSTDGTKIIFCWTGMSGDVSGVDHTGFYRSASFNPNNGIITLYALNTIVYEGEGSGLQKSSVMFVNTVGSFFLHIDVNLTGTGDSRLYSGMWYYNYLISHGNIDMPNAQMTLPVGTDRIGFLNIPPDRNELWFREYSGTIGDIQIISTDSVPAYSTYAYGLTARLDENGIMVWYAFYYRTDPATPTIVQYSKPADTTTLWSNDGSLDGEDNYTDVAHLSFGVENTPCVVAYDPTRFGLLTLDIATSLYDHYCRTITSTLATVSTGNAWDGGSIVGADVYEVSLSNGAIAKRGIVSGGNILKIMDSIILADNTVLFADSQHLYSFEKDYFKYVDAPIQSEWGGRVFPDDPTLMWVVRGNFKTQAATDIQATIESADCNPNSANLTLNNDTSEKPQMINLTGRRFSSHFIHTDDEDFELVEENYDLEKVSDYA